MSVLCSSWLKESRLTFENVASGVDPLWKQLFHLLLFPAFCSIPICVSKMLPLTQYFYCHKEGQKSEKKKQERIRAPTQ